MASCGERNRTITLARTGLDAPGDTTVRGRRRRATHDQDQARGDPPRPGCIAKDAANPVDVTARAVSTSRCGTGRGRATRIGVTSFCQNRAVFAYVVLLAAMVVLIVAGVVYAVLVGRGERARGRNVMLYTLGPIMAFALVALIGGAKTPGTLAGLAGALAVIGGVRYWRHRRGDELLSPP